MTHEYTLHMGVNPPIPEGRASRVMMVNYDPREFRQVRKRLLEQGMPTKPNRAHRRAKARLIARRRTSLGASAGVADTARQPSR